MQNCAEHRRDSAIPEVVLRLLPAVSRNWPRSPSTTAVVCSWLVLLFFVALTQGEVYRGLCFAVICCDRVSDIESKRFVSSRLTLCSLRLSTGPRCQASWLWVRLWTRPSLCNDRCQGWSRQCIYRGGAAEADPYGPDGGRCPCRAGAAGSTGAVLVWLWTFPAHAWTSGMNFRPIHRQGVQGLKRLFLAAFCGICRTPSSWTLSPRGESDSQVFSHPDLVHQCSGMDKDISATFRPHHNHHNHHNHHTGSNRLRYFCETSLFVPAAGHVHAARGPSETEDHQFSWEAAGASGGVRSAGGGSHGLLRGCRGSLGNPSRVQGEDCVDGTTIRYLLTASSALKKKEESIS